MKFTDLNDNLNEGPISGPAGFAKRAKAKLQKNVPFARQQQAQGKAKDKLFKQAKEIKDELKVWMGEIGKKEIGMKTFLDWVNNRFPSQYDGILTAAKDIHTNLFPKDSKADIQNQVSTDGVNYSVELDKTGAPKKEVKPEQYSDEEKAAIKKKYADDAEAEAKELGSEDEKQDVKASKGEDEKPKVDTSASIYESRFRAILEADTDQSLAASADGKISDDPLKDDQIDTLIVKGLQKQQELAGTGKSKTKPEGDSDWETAQAEEKPEAGATSAKAAKSEKPAKAPSSGKLSDQDFSNLADKVQEVLRGGVRKIIQKANIDEGEKKKMLSELDTFIVNSINQIGDNW